ncbi:MAG: endo-1,4-beta-xylanase [Treponema sp.]|nr:endo-1,4-beta-xylanase [Treponema sp.]
MTKTKQSLKFLSVFLLAASLILSSCSSKNAETQKTANPVQTKTQEIPEANLYKLAQAHGFKLGAVISAQSVTRSNYTEMVKADFNSITASNEFKAYSLANQQLSMKSENGMPVMVYKNADAIAQFAMENGIGVRGHVLVWDAYMPDWFFREGYTKTNSFVDRETMCKRLQYYIEEVVSHFETNYPGVVYCWDVVNEAVADGTNECKASDPRHVRIKRGGSTNLFYEVIGPDYVELAFKYARDAANKVNPNIKLFYNDYNTFYSGKRDAITQLINSINKEEKLCDGLGMQGYIGGYGQQAGCMNPNDIKLVREAIYHYASLGLEVQLTELALRNYDKDQMAAHEIFYKDFFTMLAGINSADNIRLTGVSIWGLTDDPSALPSSYGYKMNGPFCGVYNAMLKKKGEYTSIVDALK